MPKKARSPSTNPRHPKGIAEVKRPSGSGEEPPSRNPSVNLTVSHERKWWETWWGTSIILTFTAVVAGIIVSRITEHTEKPVLPTPSPAAETSPRTESPKPRAERDQGVPSRHPQVTNQLPEEKPVDRNVIHPSAPATGPNLNIATRPTKDFSSPANQMRLWAKNTLPASGSSVGSTRRGFLGRAGAAGHGDSSSTLSGKIVALKSGGTASFRADGQIRSVDHQGMHIEISPHGELTVVSQHNGAIVVTTGKESGYIQRPYMARGGHSYVSRTYVVDGHTYVRVYRSYYHAGQLYYSYYPSLSRNPNLIEWAYQPWPGPVAWSWGWGGAPWYGYYSGYFTPYSVYPSGSFWLTDQLLASDLRAAYRARAEASSSDVVAAGNSSTDSPTGTAGSVAPLTPEIKQSIADEVTAQLAAEEFAFRQPQSGGSAAPSSAEVPPALDPARRTFVVSAEITVVADDRECVLSAADVITRLADTPDPDGKVKVIVDASQKSDCPAGKTVTVSVEDLQEMQNQFRVDLETGLAELASKQGVRGLPKAPDPNTVAGEVPLPPPDPSAEKALQDQRSAAEKLLEEITKESHTSSAP